MIRICETIEKDLKIIWIKNEDLGSPFKELYHPLNHPTVKTELIELNKRPFLYSDRLLGNPRQKLYNAFLKQYQKFYFDKVLHARETALLKTKGYDFLNLKNYQKPYISSWGKMDDKTFNSSIFEPVDSIKPEIITFKTPTIGVHIRRTDHSLVINKTPLERFYQMMDQELIEDPKVKFFVASDSAEVKVELEKRYPDHLITTSPLKSERGSSKGMINAMIDLYSLANTKKIIGTSLSTFTLMASEIKGIKLIEIGK
ncbi:MAG: hypothetical protein ACFHWX_11735 [Bacteroidota bacterium]